MRFDVTQHPAAGWLSRQVTDAFPWETAPRYLLRVTQHMADTSTIGLRRWESQRSSRQHDHLGRTPMLNA